jgi:hypothetical protein
MWRGLHTFRPQKVTSKCDTIGCESISLLSAPLSHCYKCSGLIRTNNITAKSNGIMGARAVYLFVALYWVHKSIGNIITAHTTCITQSVIILTCSRSFVRTHKQTIVIFIKASIIHSHGRKQSALALGAYLRRCIHGFISQTEVIIYPCVYLRERSSSECGNKQTGWCAICPNMVEPPPPLSEWERDACIFSCTHVGEGSIRRYAFTLQIGPSRRCVRCDSGELSLTMLTQWLLSILIVFATRWPPENNIRFVIKLWWRN